MSGNSKPNKKMQLQDLDFFETRYKEIRQEKHRGERIGNTPSQGCWRTSLGLGLEGLTLPAIGLITFL
jgi:hypothetical protein